MKTDFKVYSRKIHAYPYTNGFDSDTNDDAGLTRADLQQFHGPSVRI